MLMFLQTFISLAAVLLLCVFCVRCLKLPAGLAPLTVLCASILYFVVFGSIGFLRFGGYLYFALALAAGVYIAATRKKGEWKSLFTPGFILFCLLAFVCLCVFSVRRPIIYEWDEYSFWGTAARLTKDYNRLHPEASFGWPWPATQKAGLPVLSYLFNFFGDFADWRLYFAYDTLLFAVAAAIIGGLSIQKWVVAVPVALGALVLPFFHVYTRMIYFTPPYVSSYADMPMGFLMGGALAAYYMLSRYQNGRHLWSVALMLACVTMCKDTGLPLAFVAAGIMTIDLLFCHKTAEFTMGTIRAKAPSNGQSAPLHMGNLAQPTRPLLRGAAAKGAAIALLFGGSAVFFKLWSVYLTSLGVAQGAVGGESNLSPVALVYNGLLLLFGINNTEITALYAEKFALVRDNMLANFFTAKVTMFGAGFVVFLLLFALLALIVLFTRKPLLRRRAVLYGVFATLGFCAYYAFLGFTYVFVFKGEAGVQLQDYNRYVNSYYIAMLAGAFALLAIAAADGSRARDLLTAVVIALGAGMLLLFARYLPKQLCVVDYPDVVYSESRILRAEVQSAKAEMSAPPARVFFVSQKDIGRNWFMHSYEFLPYILDYSWGGGALGDPAVLTENEAVSYKVSIGQLAAYLVDSGCEYLYLADSDSQFWRSYGPLFAQPHTNGSEAPALYKIEVKEGYTIREEAAQNGEMMQSGSDLPLPAGTVKPIRVMQNPAQYLCLVEVEMQPSFNN